MRDRQEGSRWVKTSSHLMDGNNTISLPEGGKECMTRNN